MCACVTKNFDNFSKVNILQYVGVCFIILSTTAGMILGYMVTGETKCVIL